MHSGSSAQPRTRCGIGVSLLLILLPIAASAQDDFFNTIDVEVEESGSGDFSLLGWAIQKVGYGYQAPGIPFSRQESDLNKVETSLYAQLDLSLGERTRLRVSGKAYHDEIYRLREDTPVTDAEINEFRNRFEVRDFYIEHETDQGIYFKFGNQILAWGMSEYLRVTDLINSEDLYTFGQQDLQDLRLPEPALLTSFSLAGWTLDAVITHAAGSNNRAPAGDEFDPFIALRQPGVVIEIKDPEREQEFFLRASRQWARGDIQWMAGEFNDNALTGIGIRNENSGVSRHTYGQPRSRALGLAGNWVEGAWLLFAELGLHENRAVRPNRQTFLEKFDGWERRDQWLGALGIEYSGYRNLLLSVEFDTIHTRDHDLSMLTPEDQFSFGARLFWTAMNERLQVLGVWNELADDAGRIGRLSVEYDWSDAFSTGLLWVTYDSQPESVFYPYRHNDIIQAQLRYNFQF